jgi:hypothetical protein
MAGLRLTGVTAMKKDQRPTEVTTRRFNDPRIIEFKPRPGPRLSGKSCAPIVDPLRQFDTNEYRLRMQQNLAAIMVLALILAGGLWLFHELRMSSRTLLCIEAGYNNCRPIDWREAFRH